MLERMIRKILTAEEGDHPKGNLVVIVTKMIREVIEQIDVKVLADLQVSF
jgi:hypothetical protein